MRTSRAIIAAAVLLAALIPASGFAQVESTPIPAPHKPDFSSVSFLVGSWTCSSKSSRRPRAFTTVSTYSLDPTGYWMEETSTTPKTSWVPTTLRTWDKITYDPDAKRWVDVSYGDGGGYGLSFSKGWNGNEIVWHDVSFVAGPDINSQTDITTTKVSATKMTSTSSFTETKTGRRVTVTTTCMKG
ncbi:MAG: hypothetical protein ABSF08_02370 [Candidatus Cybelea sp.]|jgi:hypothetical protein